MLTLNRLLLQTCCASITATASSSPRGWATKWSFYLLPKDRCSVLAAEGTWGCSDEKTPMRHSVLSEANSKIRAFWSEPEETCVGDGQKQLLIGKRLKHIHEHVRKGPGTMLNKRKRWTSAHFSSLRNIYFIELPQCSEWRLELHALLQSEEDFSKGANVCKTSNFSVNNCWQSTFMALCNPCVYTCNLIDSEFHWGLCWGCVWSHPASWHSVEYNFGSLEWVENWNR